MSFEQRKQRHRLIVIGLFVSLFAAIALSFCLGRYPVSIRELWGVLTSKIIPVQPFWEPRLENVLFHIRLPRILLACMVGGSLAAAGVSYQGIFQNPMASPDVLGASAGASFGAALGILLHGSGRTIMALAFLFSLLAVGLVLLFGQRAKGKRVIALILSGIMVGSLFSAGTSFVKLVADPSNQLPAITYWLMGSLSGAHMRDVRFAVLPLAIGILPLLLLRFRINLLTLGDAQARTMGIPVRLTRGIVILASTLVTAAAVAVSGTIGWIGLVIPHLSRRLVGNDYRHLMPASILMGALFLLLVDNVSRNLFTTEIPLGILTAFIGAPFFLHLIIKGGEGI